MFEKVLVMLNAILLIISGGINVILAIYTKMIGFGLVAGCMLICAVFLIMYFNQIVKDLREE